MLLYEYQTAKNESLLSISARCMLPYATIASVNNIAYITAPLAGKILIIPSIPGLYIPISPKNKLEQTLYQRYYTQFETAKRIKINKKDFFFLPGEDFNAKERVLFLSPPLRFPLRIVHITSLYGFRIHPVYHTRDFHKGIDIDAKDGDPIYSAYDGQVENVGFDQSFGNYVLVRHDISLTTYYAHLNAIRVKKGDHVTQETILGSAGSTGVSTGTHLHFEVHVNGKAVNPLQLLPKY